MERTITVDYGILPAVPATSAIKERYGKVGILEHYADKGTETIDLARIRRVPFVPHPDPEEQIGDTCGLFRKQVLAMPGVRPLDARIGELLRENASRYRLMQEWELLPEGEPTYFFGTVFERPNEYRYVGHLYMWEGRMRWKRTWIHQSCDETSYAAVLELTTG